jgi:hypothetical protein
MKDILEYIENDNLRGLRTVVEAELSRIALERIQSLAEEDQPSASDVAGTIDDPTLSPDFEKEFFLKRFEVNGNTVILKKLGLGSSAPVTSYINDERWEIFTTVNQAERETTNFINDGSYDKKVKEKEEKKKELEAQKKAEEEAKQQPKEEPVEEPKEEPVKESADIPTIRIDRLRTISESKRPCVMRFRSGEDRVITAEEASNVVEIYDVLNKENQSKFDLRLKEDEEGYQKMINFFKDRMIKGII